MANTYTLISSNTVGAGGAASITFNSVPSTYTHLIVVASLRVASGGGQGTNVLVRLNGDTGTNYAFRAIEAYSGTSKQSYNGTSQTYALGGGATTDATTANTFGTVEIIIPNYTSSGTKSVSMEGWCEYNSATLGPGGMYANTWSGTSAVTSVTVYCPANLAQYSSAYLYGIKNS